MNVPGMTSPAATTIDADIPPRPSCSALRLPMVFSLALVASALVSSCSGSGTNLEDGGANQDGSEIPEDHDGDGFPASQDCDDNDPEIYPGVSRDCQSACDYGIQVCLANGEWNDCTARTDCDCDSPGDTRIIDCGYCGQASQECGLDLLWDYPAVCLGEGECQAGALEEAYCDICGLRIRLCSAECTWGAWDSSACFGDCFPGAQDISTDNCELGLHRPMVCGVDCTWEPDGECTGACTELPRTGSTEFADEVCVEGGLFYMGNPDPAAPSEQTPMHLVALSPFIIGIHEVTVGRYRACVQAGFCSEPESWTDCTYYRNNSDHFPVTCVNWAQALEYCNWDGGRTLPTEAQWEKAARGPYPRELTRPWGEELTTTDHVPLSDSVYVGSYPLDVSYYGVEQMCGNVEEWVYDWLGDYSETQDPPLLDPLYPPFGDDYRGVRGESYQSTMAGHDTCVTTRYSLTWFLDPKRIGFRCARPGL